MRNLFLPLLIMATLPAASQQKKYIVPPQEPVREIITDKEAYFYPVFQKGMVHFNNGRSSSSTFNYHSLFDEFHYLAPNGDTLALANESSIKFLVAGTDTFYYIKGFLRLGSETGKVKLLVKNIIALSEKQKSTGGYGYSSHAGVESFNAIASRQIFEKLRSNEQMIFIKEPEYFLSDENNELFTANRSNFFKLFRDQKKKMEDFLKASPVNFKKEADLKKLMQFIRENIPATEK